MTEFDLGNDFLNVTFVINLVTVMGIVGIYLDIGLELKVEAICLDERHFFFKKKYCISRKNSLTNTEQKPLCFLDFYQFKTFAPVIAGIVEMDKKEIYVL
jgi:hypothetical protein